MPCRRALLPCHAAMGGRLHRFRQSTDAGPLGTSHRKPGRESHHPVPRRRLRTGMVTPFRTGPGNWLSTMRRYLVATALGNLVWGVRPYATLHAMGTRQSGRNRVRRRSLHWWRHTDRDERAPRRRRTDRCMFSGSGSPAGCRWPVPEGTVRTAAVLELSPAFEQDPGFKQSIENLRRSTARPGARHWCALKRPAA